MFVTFFAIKMYSAYQYRIKGDSSMFYRNIIDKLVSWKNSKNRKPLILRGARQVGKTTAVLMFGEKHFSTTLKINLENISHRRLFDYPLSIEDFETIIRIHFHTSLSPKTLIFIDEIQHSKNLLQLLRFFKEERPEIPVICAGSLLEAMISKGGYQIPVGRVTYEYMYPLTFYEYLNAADKTEILGYLKNIHLDTVIPDSIHFLLLKEINQYSLIGGMPEIVSEFCSSTDYQSLLSIYNSLLTGYVEDVFKYTNQSQSKYTQFVIEHAPYYAGERITYNKFSNSQYGSREISASFDLVEKVMLLKRIRGTVSTNLPIESRFKMPPKIIFLDVGLVNTSLGINPIDFMNNNDLNAFFNGKIAEQIVCQHLISQRMSQQENIFYWAKPKHKGNAEVDFCFSYKGKIIGLEVKSGKSGTLKSLIEFSKIVSKPVLVRVYAGKMRIDRLASTQQYFLSIPFYLIPSIEVLLDEMIDFGTNQQKDR